MIAKKDKTKNSEEEAKALVFDLSEKLEKKEISIEEMLKEIDEFLTKEK